MSYIELLLSQTNEILKKPARPILVHTTFIIILEMLVLHYSGAVEIPGYILCVPALNKFGRQLPIALMLLMAGGSLLASVYTPDTSKG